MRFQGDPYRILGLTPGASVNEIRSAYRRLAKRYHPDAAGERAVPRFLAIQAAYEALVDPNGNLRRRGPGAAPPGRPGSPGGPARSPGDAGGTGSSDGAGAGASRDAWRTRGRTGAGPAQGGRPPTGRTGGSSRDGATDGGSAGPSSVGGSGTPDGEGEAHPHRRWRRTATPGSTTYDEAREATLDPEWDGGTWYGASSGTYWTLNPREYADPRKHGPEYRRRAWRAASHRPRESAGPDAEGASAEPVGVPQSTGSGDPSWSGGAPSEPPEPPPDPAPAAGATGRSALQALASLRVPQQLLHVAEGGLPGRAVVAALAAAPVLVAAWAGLGAVAGCSAGGCPPLVPALAVLAWAVAWAVVSAVPVASALGAFAAVVAGAAALGSGALVATTSGDLIGSVLGAAGTVGVVLYAFALVIGGAWLYGGRERSVPDP